MHTIRYLLSRSDRSMSQILALFRRHCAIGLLLLFAMLSASIPRTLADENGPKFFKPVVKNIEGWTVRVDPSLLGEEHREVGEQALKALANHLQRITYLVPKEKLKELRTLPIWLERHHPTLGNMQYHPGKGWLLANGHDPALTKHVHIPRAEQLYQRRTWAKHPYVILHELAHAYHDQILDFDHQGIRDAYEEAKKSKRYENVLLFTGKKVRHYGLTNHKEYFAEATEAYFGVNDFYPFVRAELREFDPRMYRLLEKIWGPIP